MTITFLYLFLTNTLSIFLGVFASNFTFLWIIGKQAQAVEKARIEKAMEASKRFAELANKEMQRQRDYMRMEG